MQPLGFWPFLGIQKFNDMISIMNEQREMNDPDKKAINKENERILF